MNAHRSILPIALLTLFTTAALADSNREPAADAKRVICSNATIKGGYGYYGTGTTLPNEFGIPPGPFISLGTARFDGAGNLSWTSADFPGWRLSGVYNVWPDCTGTVMFDFPPPFPPATGHLVVVDGGNELFIAPPNSPELVTVAVFVYRRQ
jgi:hypothetical protein